MQLRRGGCRSPGVRSARLPPGPCPRMGRGLGLEQQPRFPRRVLRSPEHGGATLRVRGKWVLEHHGWSPCTHRPGPAEPGRRSQDSPPSAHPSSGSTPAVIPLRDTHVLLGPLGTSFLRGRQGQEARDLRVRAQPPPALIAGSEQAASDTRRTQPLGKLAPGCSRLGVHWMSPHSCHSTVPQAAAWQGG